MLELQSYDYSTYSGGNASPEKKSKSNVPSKYWKWYILLLASVITFGGYYSFDFPSVTHNQLYRHFHSSLPPSLDIYEEKTRKKEFEFQFNLLFSLYSLPNMILPLLGGIAIDKMGNNRVVFITATLVLLGNILQTYACYQVNMIYFLLGRFLFGLGAECLQVCANIIISKWFNGMELAFAMALNLSCCKLAGVLTDWLSPYFESRFGVAISSFVVSFVCILCYFGALLLIYEEVKYDFRQTNVSTSSSASSPTSNRVKNITQPSAADETFYPIPDTINLGIDPSTKSSSKTVQHHYYQYHDFCAPSPSISPTNIPSSDQMELAGNYSSSQKQTRMSRDSTFSDVTFEQHHFIEEQKRLLGIDRDLEESNVEVEEDREEENEQFNTPTTVTQQLMSIYEDLQQLPAIAWCLFVMTFLMYGTFIPFSNISNSILLEVFYQSKGQVIDMRKFEIIAARSDIPFLRIFFLKILSNFRLQSIPYLLTVFATPVLGMMVDWYGYRTVQLFVSAGCLLTAHLAIYAASLGALIPLILIGLSYSIFGSVSWPCVPLLVEERHHGTAYGLMAAFQNSAQFLIPLVLAEIYRWTETYRAYEFCFFVTSFIAMLISLYIWFLDETSGQANLRQPSPMKQ